MALGQLFIYLIGLAVCFTAICVENIPLAIMGAALTIVGGINLFAA